ncbi:MAG TPA: hypothetical protein VKC56_07720 [Gallionellaceae bacterium]|nr:hypothetical protein [Gallionellaceae bacterium]
MWLIKRLIVRVGLYLLQVALFCLFVPLLLSLIQLWGPYEDAQSMDTNRNGKPIKVIKLGEGSRLFVGWCCQKSANGVVNQDRYVRALEMGRGIVEAGSSHSTYSFDLNSITGVRVTLKSGGDVFVYDIQGAQIHPIKRKVLNGWKIISSLVGALLITVLATRLARQASVAWRRRNANSVVNGPSPEKPA